MGIINHSRQLSSNNVSQYGDRYFLSAFHVLIYRLICPLSIHPLTLHFCPHIHHSYFYNPLLPQAITSPLPFSPTSLRTHHSSSNTTHSSNITHPSTHYSFTSNSPLTLTPTTHFSTPTIHSSNTIHPFQPHSITSTFCIMFYGGVERILIRFAATQDINLRK